MPSAPPVSPDPDDLASLRAEIEASFHEDPVNRAWNLDRLDLLAGPAGSGAHAWVMLLLFNLLLEEEEARRHWEGIREHRQGLEGALGRAVALRVAALDYLVELNHRTPRARLLEVLQVHMPPEKEITDPLTGLHTASFLADQLPREVGRARRYKLDLSLVHLEIDDYGSAVERQGRSIGTLQLREVADVLRECLRGSDYAARVSSAAFVLLLTETDRMGAFFVAERIRQKVEEFYLRQRLNGRPFGLTVSAGVASFGEDAESAEDLADKAREAFYNARARGRSRVAVHYRERREYMRLALDSADLQITLVPEGAEAGPAASMKNISSGGVLFESDRAIDLGRTVQIRCRNRRDAAQVVIPGRVVRIEKFESDAGPRYEIGVLFDLMVEEQVEGVVQFLERFISERAAEEGRRPAPSE